MTKRVQVEWKLAKQLLIEKVREVLFYAKKNYYQQPNFSTWRKEFHKASIEALAIENNTSAEAEHKQEKREEQSKKMGKASQRITGKGIKTPVLRATISNEDGEEKELTSQETIVPAIAQSNIDRQKQSEHTPFMSEPLFSNDGYLCIRRPQRK